jgi:hypothetical protein
MPVRAVRNTTGMEAVCGSPFSAWHTSRPDTSGMSMSSRMRSGRGSANAAEMASPPLSAVITR